MIQVRTKVYAIKVWINLRFFPDFIRSVRRLRSLERELTQSNGDLFDVPFLFDGYGEFKSIRPKQVRWEIQTLYQRIRGQDARYLCEIGTYRGGTLYLWCKAAADDASLIAVDLPGRISNFTFSARRRSFYRRFVKSATQTMHFICADSHQESTVSSVAHILDSSRLDFLFIDGDHSYAGVNRDFELYGPLVRKGGIVAFHDILPRSNLPEVQVHRFWNEIKRGYRHEEIIAQEGRYANLIGIGALWID